MFPVAHAVGSLEITCHETYHGIGGGWTICNGVAVPVVTLRMIARGRAGSSISTGTSVWTTEALPATSRTPNWIWACAPMSRGGTQRCWPSLFKPFAIGSHGPCGDAE